jgi:hypothetical protein
MKRWLLAVLLSSLLAAPSAFAQKQGDMATQEDIQQLFDVMNSRKMLDAIMASVRQQSPALSEGALKKYCPNATPEQLAKMNEFANKQVDKMLSNMPIDEMMKAMIPTYRRHFTHADVQELLAFYSSRVGKKLIAEIPAITSEAGAAMRPTMQKWMDASMAATQADLERYAKSLNNEKPTGFRQE